MKKLSSEWILNKPIFQKLVQDLGPVDVDLFASRLCHQIAKYISWQPDPHAWMVDAFQINWTHLKFYVFSPFALVGRVLAKAMRCKCTLIIITPLWSSQPWYTQLLRCLSRSNFHSPISKFFDRPEPNPTPIMSESSISLSSMKGLRQQYSAEDLSDQTIDLLESSQRPGTLHHYKTGWRKWGSLCLSRYIALVSPGVNCVLKVLSNLFSQGLEYRTINGYRPAIPAYHEKAEEILIGQHPKVCQLLSGVFNKRPPQPKYTVIRDISKVIDYLNTLGNNENLSTKIITLKLTTLLAILSSKRASEVTYLDIRHILFKENSVIFHFSKLANTWKKGKKSSIT